MIHTNITLLDVTIPVKHDGSALAPIAEGKRLFFTLKRKQGSRCTKPAGNATG
jgi:hypothetical protein